MIERLQRHTVELYHLENEDYVIEKILAYQLLDVTRFDLFAKLCYLKYRTNKRKYAEDIYKAHIKSFNPDLKEPGRDDKNGYQDFIDTFELLIDTFQKNDFNPTISLVPVDKNYIPLDGSHRIAALVFFNKKIDVVRFINIESKSLFNYKYFINRGIPINIADKIAYEALSLQNNIYVACLWPKIGKRINKDLAIKTIEKNFKVLYVKEISMSFDQLINFIYEIYKKQEWVGNKLNKYAGAKHKASNCYKSGNSVSFVFFQAHSLNEVLDLKNQIREFFQIEKHALHITDNQSETKEVANLILTEKSGDFSKGVYRLKDFTKEKVNVFRTIYLIQIKVFVANFLSKLKLYRKNA